MILSGRSDLVTGRLVTSSTVRVPSGGTLKKYRFFFLKTTPRMNFTKLSVSTKYDILKLQGPNIKFVIFVYSNYSKTKHQKRMKFCRSGDHGDVQYPFKNHCYDIIENEVII